MKDLRKWILIVDDEREIVRLSRSLLEFNFGEVAKFVEAYDGAEATAKISYQAFDVIITDIRMPRKEGNAFIQSVRESPMNQGTPIIALSGFIDEFSATDSHVHLLEKPVDSQKLVEIVESQLKLGRKTDQRIAADLLNAVVQSGHQFLERAIQSAPEQMAPMARVARQDLCGDLVHHFAIKVGKVKNDFVIGFSKETLEAVSKGQVGSDMSEDKLCATASKALIQHAIKYLKATNSSIKVLQSQAIHKGENEYGDLTKKFGIVVPLKTDAGEVAVQALWDRVA